MKTDSGFDSLIQTALREDRAKEDITSRILIPSRGEAIAHMVSKSSGVVCGVDIARRVFMSLDPGLKVRCYRRDGQNISPGERIMTVKGNARGILAGERTALNFLQHLSGVATMTSKFVSAVKGSGVEIYDTRKTIPGLRKAQKYAVRCGGGKNHRSDLSSAVMVKDNHYKFMKSPLKDVRNLKSKIPKGVPFIMEADSMKEILAALGSGAGVVMLDNMSLSRIREAVRLIRRKSGGRRSGSRIRIEVSGGVNLGNVQSISRLGVDRISVGTLTHSAPALDLSMEFESDRALNDQ